MSTVLRDLSKYSEAAQGAYAFFTTPSAAETALREPGRGDFVTTEARRMLGVELDPRQSGPQGFEFRDHQPDDPTGFSATVFFDRSSNKYVLSIRGTEDLKDIFEDVARVGAQGFAGDQLVSLYRYYKKLTTPAGQRVQYSDSEITTLQLSRLGVPVNGLSTILNPLRGAALRDELAADVGILPKSGGGASVIPAGAPLIVTGHSLGGHLALLFGRFFPEVTEHVYTYDAPGISAVGELGLRALGIPPIAPSLVTNVDSVLGHEAIANIWSKPGEDIGIATEPGTLLHQHSIVPLTDTLALYGAFGTLSPGSSLDASAVSGIIQAASPLPDDGIEIVVDELGRLLQTGSDPTPIAHTGSDRVEREAYFENLYRLLDSREPGRDYRIVSLAGKSAGELANMGVTEVGTRYALSELLPFSARNANYSAFDGNFSGEWIQSRAEMLAALNESRRVDQQFSSSGTAQNLLFEDHRLDVRHSVLGARDADLARQYVAANGQARLQGFLNELHYDQVTIFASNPGPGEALAGLGGRDHLFGGTGADSLDGGAGDDFLEGGAGADILIGGAGDDTLVGGEGADRLEGGPGEDAYVYAVSLDGDTISDTDGRILVGGLPLMGGRGMSGGAYQSADGQYSYAFSGDLDLGGTLTVNGTLRVENFHNGDLGIRLRGIHEPESAPPPAPPGGTLLQGDYDYFAYEDPVTHVRTRGSDEYGNPSAPVVLVSHPDRVDTYEDFPGTPGATHFVSGGGDDIMQDILGGNDWLELGTGDDFGWGGTGNDLVEGGAGRDIVAGGRGDDVLYAGTRDSKADDLDAAAVPALSGVGDLLSGGDGNDIVFGDAEANLIEGGSGSDQIYAGAGDDWIGADVSVLAADERYRIFPPNNDWVNREVDILWNPYRELPSYALGPVPGFGLPRQASINGRSINPISSPTDGRDYIDAGAGNDTIFAGGGDDIIIAGSGDDYVDPGTGMDTVSMGAGRDYFASWFGDSVGDDIDAGEGDDFVVDMASGGNRIDGGGGNDYIQAGMGADLLIGGDGDDRISSFGGDDIIQAGAGNDTVRSGGSGNTLLAGGAGNDRMIAAIQNYGGSATFLWGPGDGNDMGLMLGGRGTLQIGELGPGDVSVRYVTGVATGEFLVEDQPEARGSGFEFTIGDGAETFNLLEVPELFAPSDLSVRFADGTTWDDAYLRSLAAGPGAPADPVELPGSDSDDITYGSEGGDRFAGSKGNDWLLGGAGDDLYQYGAGDGFDQIEDSDGNADTIQLASGIGTGDVSVFAAGSDYIFAVGDGGLRVRGGRTPEGAIERIEFADGTRWTPTDLEGRAEMLPDNRAPEMPPSFGRVSVDPGEPVQVTLPGDAISDPDLFDAVGLYAITAEGEKLPAWLKFDAASRTLSGTPGEGDAGVHEIVLIAADTSGAAAVGSLTIAVGPDLAAPDVPGPSAPPVVEPTAPEAAPVTAAQPSSSPQGETGPDPAASPASSAPHDAALSPQDKTFLSEADASARAQERPAFMDSADPVFREVQHRLDVLLQTGRTNLGERYAEAIREFEERRQQREEAPLPPPPTEEEVEAWNSAMHSWHDRNPGFAETELGTNDGTWSVGWGMPGARDSAVGDTLAAASATGLANPNALARLQGATALPALQEGIRQIL